MRTVHPAAPKPQKMLNAWVQFKQVAGVACVYEEREYQRAKVVVESLLNKIGDDESNPLMELLDFFSNQVEAYEDENIHIPDAEPKEVLRFLMDQHGLRQGDLKDCAPQGRISDILKGKRSISKDIAKKLAQRFHVGVEVFL